MQELTQKIIHCTFDYSLGIQIHSYVTERISEQIEYLFSSIKFMKITDTKLINSGVDTAGFP